MNRRETLIKLVSGAFALLLLVFLWILFKGISFIDSHTKPTVKSHDTNKTHPLYKGLSAGESTLRRYNRGVVWVTHITPIIAKNTATLTPYLLAPESGCYPALSDEINTYCVLDATTNASGIYMQFSQSPPPQLPSTIPWYGGFVDPSNGNTFDLLGRAYKLNKTNSNNLPVVTVTF